MMNVLGSQSFFEITGIEILVHSQELGEALHPTLAQCFDLLQHQLYGLLGLVGRIFVLA